MEDSALALWFGSVLVYNFVLVQFLGLCPYMGVSRQVDSAVGMSVATAFVLTLASASSYLIYNYLLVPLELAYLRTIAFIIVIAALVQLTEMIIRKTSPLLHKVLGVFLPLITSNCAVLGVALLNTYGGPSGQSLFNALVYGFGAAVGFSLVLILLAAMRERMVSNDAPEAFQGPALAMISAGLMALTFMGFTGMV